MPNVEEAQRLCRASYTPCTRPHRLGDLLAATAQVTERRRNLDLGHIDDRRRR
jgi:hypothetical protein